MTRTFRLLLAAALAALTTLPVAADDKDFLRPGGTHVPANLFIVFGNTQTTTQTISALTGSPMSTWDGDGDSPSSKLGAAKLVVRQFVQDFSSSYNIGMTAFSRPPNVGTTISRKHWVYQSLDVDFPNDSFKEPAGTLERWGPFGEGPCTSTTIPSCTAVSTNYINFVAPYASGTTSFTLPGGGNPPNIFFGANPTSTTYAYILLDAATPSAAHKRLRISVTAGNYGDAFTDGTLSTLTLGTHSMAVRKEYQTCNGGNCGNNASNWISNWTTQSTTPGGSPGTVTVRYRPPTTMPPLWFYPTGATNNAGASIAGRYVGFESAHVAADNRQDFDMGSNCSGLEFQNTGHPLVKIPRDYSSGQSCSPPQTSLNCIKRLLRPQAYLETYDASAGTFVQPPNDPDNPGYRTGVTANKYLDGCDPTVMGTVQDGLDNVERQVILTARNGSQAPIKDALVNILDYFSKPSIDGFQNGVRTDDPNKACRNSAVIFIYDTFDGCQGAKCPQLQNAALTDLKAIGIPVYTIGFGAALQSSDADGDCTSAGISSNPDNCPLVCIPKYSGAFKADGTTPGYFPVTNSVELYNALAEIASLVNESQKGFVSSTVSVAQASGEQVTFLATFNAQNNRSIWNGRVNAYKLDSAGNLLYGTRTIRDPADPNNGLAVPAPSNDPVNSLMWNAGENLADTPGTGATNSSAILAPGAARSTSSYTDASNDVNRDVPTSFYPGRKIVFSLPTSYPDPTLSTTRLPFAAADPLPENRYDMTYNTSATWWPAVKALLSPQNAPPFVLTPAISDTDARDSLRFIWGDRDPIILAAQPSAAGTTALYSGLKLGDVFHSSPVLIGGPNQFPYYSANLHGYQEFRDTYARRRRILYFGANDGLYHAVDAGGWDRTPTQCDFDTDGVTRKHCYDLGTGAELFAYAPRATMQVFKNLKDTIGTQTKRNEWTVDGSATAGDVFIDSSHSGTPIAADRAWTTVLVGGMREGSAFEGTSGAAPADSQGSYYALDITQPDALTADTNGKPLTIIPATFNAPLCLNANGDATCGKDATDATVRGTQPARAYPTVLWEITDVGDQDAIGTVGASYVDMGETWSKPSLGRVRVCITNCGNSAAPFPVFEDHYVAVFGGGFDRQRLNRRGNWLYMVDVETGKVLYRANSSCGINAGSGGCSPTYFGSIPSEPSAIDGNGDGYIDTLYIGDLKGRMWRIDLTDLRMLSSPPTGRFDNKIDVVAGSGKPFLLFSAPQPSGTNVHPFYPIYYRPTIVTLGYSVAGRPAVGVGFGTGDRDDINSTIEPLAMNFRQRFYYVVDRNNSTTMTESDLTDIASPTAPSLATAPANGWFIELLLGERMNADILTVGGVVFFTTFNPATNGTPTGCPGNTFDCATEAGTARLYRVNYATGNPYLGADRGQTQSGGSFLSEPVYFQAQDQSGNVIYTNENTVNKESAPGGKRTSVKSWKERSRRP